VARCVELAGGGPGEAEPLAAGCVDPLRLQAIAAPARLKSESHTRWVRRYRPASTPQCSERRRAPATARLAAARRARRGCARLEPLVGTGATGVSERRERRRLGTKLHALTALGRGVMEAAQRVQDEWLALGVYTGRRRAAGERHASERGSLREDPCSSGSRFAGRRFRGRSCPRW
jgi:hypothetical protein